MSASVNDSQQNGNGLENPPPQKVEPSGTPAPKTPFAVPLFHACLAIIKLTTLGLVIVICSSLIYIVISVVISSDVRNTVLESFGVDTTESYESHISTETQDFNAVYPDHEAISAWVKHCIGADVVDLSFAVQAEFVLTPQAPNGVTYTSPARREWPQAVQHLNQKEKALVILSRELSLQRISLISKARAAYYFWEVTSLATICIGMITTILISVSSTEFGRGDGRNQRLIRVLAIIFPALGTAAAAAIGFYSPQTEWGQASRTLASEGQLHGQMALAIWNLTCPKSDGDEASDLLGNAIDGWSKRYIDIQAISTSIGSPNGNPGSAGASTAAERGSPAGGGDQAKPIASPSKE